jgi:hypothetical protein
MALQVTGDFQTPIGTTVPTTYWRWVGLAIDVSRATATVTLYAYVDASAFASGKTPIGQRQYTVQDIPATEDSPGSTAFSNLAANLDGPTPTGLSAAIYSYVVANDSYFAGATEV